MVKVGYMVTQMSVSLQFALSCYEFNSWTCNIVSMYYLRKFFFTNRVVNIWNSLPN